MVNPMKLLELKNQWAEFEKRHPKFVQFIMTVARNGVSEQSVIAVKITLPDGREVESNMKVTKEDIEMIKTLGELNN